MAIIFDGYGGGSDAGSYDDPDGKTRDYYDDDESHVYRPSDHRNEPTADDGYRGGSSPIGSGDIIGSITDDGRVVERIGGSGSGNVDDVGTDGTTDIFRVFTGGIGGDGSVLQQVEQAVENATGGRAFGDRGTVDTIGSGSAVVNIPVDQTPTEWIRESLESNYSALQLLSVTLGVVGGLLTVGRFVRRES